MFNLFLRAIVLSLLSLRYRIRARNLPSPGRFALAEILKAFPWVLIGLAVEAATASAP